MISVPDITQEHLAIVVHVLREHAPAMAKVWVFGSRARGDARATSDLDLAIDASRALSLSESAGLAEAFDEAPLPYSVDIVDLQAVSAEFVSLIKRDRRPLPGFAGE